MKDPDALLARAGVAGNPDRDQHFLVDDRVLDRLPTYLDAIADDSGTEIRSHVLEIGAGTGALTDRLLASCERVSVIERDRDLVQFLRAEFADAIDDGRLQVLAGDALAVELPAFTASVSNLPYGISSEIIFRLLPAKRPLVVMVQKEFADRMVAEAGTAAYGRLSVSTQHYADAELVETVPSEAFSPPPAVESAVVRLVPRDPEYTVPDEQFFLTFVKALFTQRRKTVRNAIRNTTHISGVEDAAPVVDRAPEALLSKRPDAVTPAEFASLAALAHRIERDPGQEEGNG
jgi:16S rRNA (adenine1518-N6/adenine1519-N6)-dimethyltransferase